MLVLFYSHIIFGNVLLCHTGTRVLERSESLWGLRVFGVRGSERREVSKGNMSISRRILFMSDHGLQ